ncbi:MAG: PIN domain-containing protein [Candidatus Latescibacterota bacterium]
MPDVLIDTDVAIDFLRGEAYARPLLLRWWQAGAATLSVLSVYELTAGMREQERGPTMDFIAACRVEPVSMEIATRGAELYRLSRAQGLTLTAIDCLIAAIALERGWLIATRNLRHYPQEGILLDLGIPG